jgi:crotonobetainyl-CoA:carnitine CoA-transferase CaiB-like acyl-CoA transferase
VTDPGGEVGRRGFRTKTRDEWTAVFEGSDACVAPVPSYAEAREHPHLQARGGVADVDAPLAAGALAEPRRDHERCEERHVSDDFIS